MLIENKLIVDEPLISVVVLAYNQESLISQTIDSILDQRCRYPFEIIISDDCSNDNTKGICFEYQKKYPNLIKVFAQPINKGLVINYLDALFLCRGTYIAKCDGDDYWIDPLKLEKQCVFLETYPEYGVVRTGGYCLDVKTNTMEVMKSHSNDVGYVFEKATEGALGLASSIFFRKSLLKHINHSDFVTGEFAVDDYPMNVIFSHYTQFGFITDLTTVYRLHNSGSRPLNDNQKVKYAQGFMNQRLYLKSLFPEKFKLDLQEEEEYISYTKLRKAYTFWNHTEAKKLSYSIKGTRKGKIYVKYAKNGFTFYLLCLVKHITQK